MQPHKNRTILSRRTLLRAGIGAGALVVGGTAAVGTAVSHPKPQNHEVIWGDSLDYLAGDLRTYATTNPQGHLSSLGVYIGPDALAVFDEDPLEAHLQLPDAVDTKQFTFMGFDYNPAGHPPPDIYTVPHFDVHFYMIPEETVEGIVTEPATYSIPDEQMPTDYQRLPAIDTDDDGAPDTPLVEKEMGEHLADVTALEFQEDGEFTHTMIYGAYDVDGDGTGQLTFVEPMVTNAFLNNLDGEVEVEMKTPEVYPTADEYPTQYSIKRGLHGGVYISLGGFEEFSGPESES